MSGEPKEHDIADQLGDNLRNISIAEFFEQNQQMLGFDNDGKALVTAVKEAVDNALDACEDASILPEIDIEVTDNGDYFTLTVTDNGPGLNKEDVPNVYGKLLFGSRFGKRAQTRGQQGIGISATVLYGQYTTGNPARVISKTPNDESATFYRVGIDTDTNEPELKDVETGYDYPHEHGTQVEIDFAANLRARTQLHDYVKQTAATNPYSTIRFTEPGIDETLTFEAAVDELPPKAEEINPHIHGVELGTLMKMLESTSHYSLTGFFKNEFTRIGDKTAQSIIDNYVMVHEGKFTQYSVTHDKEEIVDVIEGAVNRKGAEATSAFANELSEMLLDAEKVSVYKLSSIVNDVSDDIEDEYDIQLGETVREKVVTAIKPLLIEENSDYFFEMFDDVTTKRKNDEGIRVLAETFAEQFTDETMKREDLSNLVENCSKEATTEVSALTIGDTTHEKLVDVIWDNQMELVSKSANELPNTSKFADSRSLASDLHIAMNETDALSPPTDCLSPITEETLVKGIEGVYEDGEFYTSVTRDAEATNGEPFLVEAGIAWGVETNSDEIDILRIANRVPLVYNRGGCAISKTISNMNVRRYGFDQTGGSGIPTDDAVILVHVASTNVPFTSEAKDAVAEVPDITDEIERAVRDVSRDLDSYLTKKQNAKQREEKEEQISKMLDPMTERVSEALGVEKPDIKPSLAEIMNNVLVARETNEDGTVTISVLNNYRGGQELTVQEHLSRKPENIPDDAEITETEDGEYNITWNFEVNSEDKIEVSYDWTTDGRATSNLEVEGLGDEKVTTYEAQK